MKNENNQVDENIKQINNNSYFVWVIFSAAASLLLHS